MPFCDHCKKSIDTSNCVHLSTDDGSAIYLHAACWITVGMQQQLQSLELLAGAVRTWAVILEDKDVRALVEARVITLAKEQARANQVPAAQPDDSEVHIDAVANCPSLDCGGSVAICQGV